MKIVIDLPKVIYKAVVGDNLNYGIATICDAIREGTPLPKGHGDLIDRKELIESPLCKTFGLRSIDIENAPTIVEADTEK